MKKTYVVLVFMVIFLLPHTLWAQQDWQHFPDNKGFDHRQMNDQGPMMHQRWQPRRRRPMGQNQGIKNHQVYVAKSKDALKWEKQNQVLFDSASVPDAVLGKDGKIYLYFMDASQGHEMSVAISSDKGKTWKKQTVEISGRQEKGGEAVDPNPVLLEDGRIRLFYLGSFRKPKKIKQKRRMRRDRPRGPQNLNHIYSAISTDGIHFTEEKGIRLSHMLITDPDVIQINKEWKLFVSYRGVNISASSSDGLNFKIDPNLATTAGNISNTIPIKGGYRMFVCGQEGIESLFSKNGEEWKKEAGVRLPGNGQVICDPGIIQLQEGTYLMFYKTIKQNSFRNQNFRSQNRQPLPPEQDR